MPTPTTLPCGDIPGIDPVEAGALAHEAGLAPLVARVLMARGMRDPAGLRRFLAPRLADLTRPDDMADRDVAAARLARAVDHGEHVAVFGDYDVDGISSAALLTRVLRQLGADARPLLASRFEGGYGLSEAAVARILERAPGLVVTCDCGTSDHDRLATLRARGLDVIVLDHHRVLDEPLPALAFLNPHRPDCRFPYKHLASVGLAFSLAAALRARCCPSLDLRPLLDLVALGTVADVAPLAGDNRILTRAGLARITDPGPYPGVRALVREARLRFAITAHDVAFSLAPMLNAPGRLGSATLALDLFLAASEHDASRLAAGLSSANQRRRELSQTLLDAATAQVHEIYGAEPAGGLVVAGDGWHAGVGGIVAGRLAERFGLPVAVVAFEGDEGVGSVRAPGGVGVYGVVSACRDELLAFGGHEGAAGLRVHRRRLEALRAAFSRAASDRPAGPPPAAQLDAELCAEDLVPGLAAGLQALEPTGQGNPEPRVLIRAVRLSESRQVGGTHLRFDVALGRRTLGAFLRDGVRRLPALPAARTRVNLAGYLRPDPWSGPEAVQLDVLHLAACG